MAVEGVDMVNGGVISVAVTLFGTAKPPARLTVTNRSEEGASRSKLLGVKPSSETHLKRLEVFFDGGGTWNRT